HAASFCGDGIQEEGEQCDCGFDEMDCQSTGDKCCHWVENLEPCTRKKGDACSPFEGACCNPDNCHLFQVSGEGWECAAETECSYRSTCNGLAAKCPEPIPK
ncbi:hypothetical protein PENTCL1PPCAC_1089, partial [Pristionchus entomophagus]